MKSVGPKGLTLLINKNTGPTSISSLQGETKRQSESQRSCIFYIISSSYKNIQLLPQTRMQGMAPLLEAMNPDESSSLFRVTPQCTNMLTMMSAESSLLRDHNNFPFAAPAQLLPRRGSLLGSGGYFDPLSLMNTPIIERRASMEMSYTRRMSGFSVDAQFSCLTPSTNLNPPMDLGMSFPPLDKGEMSKQVEYNDLLLKTMKRRRSSLGLLSVLFEDSNQGDSGIQAPSRRISLSFGPPQIQSFGGPLLKKQKRAPTPPPVEIEPEPATVRLDPSVDEVKLKKTVVGFSDAMEKSQKSQQDIHDWDRKMGLKRSHSKTMRLSMRSRKKLRGLMKKNLSQLVDVSV